MSSHQQLFVYLLLVGLLSCSPKPGGPTEYAGVTFDLPAGATFERDEVPMDVVSATVHLTDPKIDIRCAIGSDQGHQKRISAMTAAEQDGIVLFDDTTIEGQKCSILALRITGDPEQQRLFVNYPDVGLALAVDAPNAKELRSALAAIKKIHVEKSQKR